MSKDDVTLNSRIVSNNKSPYDGRTVFEFLHVSKTEVRQFLSDFFICHRDRIRFI